MLVLVVELLAQLGEAPSSVEDVPRPDSGLGAVQELDLNKRTATSGFQVVVESPVAGRTSRCLVNVDCRRSEGTALVDESLALSLAGDG